MMKLICRYCNGNCDKSNPSSMWYDCKACDVNFYENDDGFTGITFFRDIKDRRYRLEVMPDKPKTFLFQIKPEFSLLFETKDALSVTPQTAIDKIKHLLTFL